MPRPLCLIEPFRIFFPAGLMIGVIGVVLWPIWVWGGMAFYPGPLHARLMLTGLFGAFVLGFLATSLPRMLGVGPLGPGAIGGLLLLWLASVVAHLAGVLWLGDLAFALSLALLLAVLGAGFPRRSDIPAPCFVLVGFGLLLGLSGALALALVGSPIELGFEAGWLFRFGRVALYEGFLLGVLAGVGAFFFPRLWGGPTRQMFPDMVRPDAAWSKQGRIALLAGIGLIAGCALDASGRVASGALLRAVSFGFFVVSEVASAYQARSESTLGTLARIGLVLIPVGLILEIVVMPTQLVGVRHLVLVSGFNLILFAVAARVIFGHSGAREASTGRMVSMRWVGGLILAAALTRFSADLAPSVYQSHLAYAAIIWLLAAFVWGFIVLKRVGLADPED